MSCETSVENKQEKCCELVSTDCVVTSEGNETLGFGVGEFLTEVFSIISNTFNALKSRIEGLETNVESIQNTLQGGATGTFESSDGKLIEVEDGIIVSIQ